MFIMSLIDYCVMMNGNICWLLMSNIQWLICFVHISYVIRQEVPGTKINALGHFSQMRSEVERFVFRCHGKIFQCDCIWNDVNECWPNEYNSSCNVHPKYKLDNHQKNESASDQQGVLLQQFFSPLLPDISPPLEIWPSVHCHLLMTVAGEFSNY